MESLCHRKEVIDWGIDLIISLRWLIFLQWAPPAVLALHSGLAKWVEVININMTQERVPTALRGDQHVGKFMIAH